MFLWHLHAFYYMLTGSCCYVPCGAFPGMRPVERISVQVDARIRKAWRLGLAQSGCNETIVLHMLFPDIQFILLLPNMRYQTFLQSDGNTNSANREVLNEQNRPKTSPTTPLSRHPDFRTRHEPPFTSPTSSRVSSNPPYRTHGQNRHWTQTLLLDWR